MTAPEFGGPATAEGGPRQRRGTRLRGTRLHVCPAGHVSPGCRDAQSLVHAGKSTYAPGRRLLYETRLLQQSPDFYNNHIPDSK
jgi:hypothetical protein